MNTSSRMFISLGLSGSLALAVGCSSMEATRHTTPSEAKSATKGSGMRATAVIKPEVMSGKVALTLSVHNEDKSDSIELEPRHLFEAEGTLGNLLTVTCEGQPVPYLGAMVKRRSTSAEQMIPVKPGQTVTSRADITSAFKFLPGRHTYQVSYEAYLSGSKPQDPLIELKSQPVDFVLEQ